MNKPINLSEHVLKFGEHRITSKEITDLLRQKNMIPAIVKDLIMEKELLSIEVSEDLEAQLTSKFRIDNNLEDIEAYTNYLETKKISCWIYNDSKADMCIVLLICGVSKKRRKKSDRNHIHYQLQKLVFG